MCLYYYYIWYFIQLSFCHLLGAYIQTINCSTSVMFGNVFILFIARVALLQDVVVQPKNIFFSELSSGMYCLQHIPLKRRSTIILHVSTSQKTILNFILAAVRTWNLTKNIWSTNEIRIYGLCSSSPVSGNICGRRSRRYDLTRVVQFNSWSISMHNIPIIPVYGTMC
jgi:hypothetical protein